MKRKKVSELAKQIRGVSYKTEDLHENLDENSVTLLRANNIFEGRINFDDVVYVDKSRVAREQYLCKDDILVCASSGSKQLVGKAASFNFDTECTFGAFCKVVRPNQDVANYLSMYFQSNAYRRKISEVAIGANINNIRNEHIDALELPIGSNAENEKVVASFSLLQQIIDGRKQQLHKLDELIKSRFIELFGDPVINPKRFPCYTVGEVIDFQGGSQPDKKYFEYEASPDNIRLIQIRDYKSDKYITYIPKTMAKRFCTADDIMIGRYGPPIFQILKGIEGSFNVALMKATPKIGNKEFVRQFLKQDCLLEYLEGLSKRTAGQDGIQMDKLKAYPFPYPPIELQEQFAAFVEQTDKSKYYSSLSFRYCQAAENAYRQEWITCRTSDF